MTRQLEQVFTIHSLITTAKLFFRVLLVGKIVKLEEEITAFNSCLLSNIHNSMLNYYTGLAT